MPARVLVVWDQAAFAENAASWLTRAGYDAIAPISPMAALDLLDGSQRIEMLITCTDFARGQPNGVALARMAKLKQPKIKVVLVGLPEHANLVRDLCGFRAGPVSLRELVDTVVQHLVAQSAPPVLFIEATSAA